MQLNNKSIGISTAVIFYIIIQCCLSLISESWSFIISGAIYVLFIYYFSLVVDKSLRTNYLCLGILFLLLYSTFLSLVHFTIIESPFQDFFINIDETGFLLDATALAKLNYSEIWSVTFTTFEYSGSPLFYAWIGTLQKTVSTGPYYSLLFQKLNVAFIGSFIPGVMYLLCTKVSSSRVAMKAASAYGILSFTFFYSVGFMRDIHIALIYVVALYIISGEEYSLKNYLILILLGLIAYYIRFENGLFFMAFIGVWMYKSGSNKKFIISIVTIIGLGGAILLLGGVETIYNMAFKTIEGYTTRAHRLADQGSLGIKLMSLPAPINYIGMAAFGQISPFPFWAVFREDISLFGNFFYLLEVIAALFWMIVWLRIVKYPKRSLVFYRKYKFVVLVVLLYIVSVSMAQAMSRRLMAVYPMIFLGYIYINNRLLKTKEIFISTLVYMFLLSIYWFLKM